VTTLSTFSRRTFPHHPAPTPGRDIPAAQICDLASRHPHRARTCHDFTGAAKHEVEQTLTAAIERSHGGLHGTATCQGVRGCNADILSLPDLFVPDQLMSRIVATPKSPTASNIKRTRTRHRPAVVLSAPNHPLHQHPGHQRQAVPQVAGVRLSWDPPVDTSLRIVRDRHSVACMRTHSERADLRGSQRWETPASWGIGQGSPCGVARWPPGDVTPRRKWAPRAG
jgi:hypothetical protein